MIQRAQSIFLAVVAICMALVCTLPIWSKANVEQTIKMNAISFIKAGKMDNSTSQSTILILLFAAIAAILAIYSLLSFKNRKLQMLLGAIISMIIAISMGFIFYYIIKVGRPAFDPAIEGNYELGFYAGGVGLLANMIANRFIRRDENLVRSSDRMR